MQQATQPKQNRLLISSGIAIVIVGAYFFLRDSSPSAPAGMRGGVVPVAASVAKVGNLDLYIDAIGSVTPVSTVTVTSRVAGQISEINFKEGQLVKKGDLLAVVDPRPYQAVLEQAQGQLQRDQAILKNAQLDLARYTDAYHQHAIPEQQYATQQALVEGDSGLVRLDEGNVAAAQVNVDYTRITSPIDGRVGLRLIDAGNIVQANGNLALTTITQLQPITVVFTLAEDRLLDVLPSINATQALTVLAFDRTQQKQIGLGKLITIDNQIDPTTGTVKGRALFSNQEKLLFPNQFVNARLRYKTLKNVVLIASSAVQMNNDQRFVYVVDENKVVSLRPVKVLATEADITAVTGINESETIVTDGFDRLQNGIKVVIRAPSAEKSANRANGVK
ncbi:MAG: efflux RND transporter periplasmic adaptor subunit [Verrucomicrobiota bacterium]|jgi:multidrug efflux system membrane fusion protein